MKTIKIFTFTLLISMLCSLTSMAQRDLYNWQISPYGGLLTLNNDIVIPDDGNSYAYGLRIERRVGNDFTVGLHLTQLRREGAAQNNLSGGFLSLGYHWDNGYLLSERSAVSIFHKLEFGFMDQYADVESISSNSGEATLGFENGIKFRLGDRLSADIALELLATEESLTEGDITKNLRYNVWKVGFSYHFGSRKSNFTAPVFVPYDGIPFRSSMNKIDRKEDNIWVVNDSIYDQKLITERFPVDSSASLANGSQLSLADSMSIFMYFDSLYQRRANVDTTGVNADTLLKETDVSTYISDTTVVIEPIDYQQNADTSVNEIQPLLVPTRVDTVYKENPNSNEQKSDTSAQGIQTQSTFSQNNDTINTESDERSQSVDEGSSDYKSKQVIDENQTPPEVDDNQKALLAEQNRQIQQNQKDIENIRKQNNNSSNNNGNNNDAGKVIAAGAVGTALGALVAGGDKKQDPDTVYYQSVATQQKIDSLELELAALKKQFGIIDTIPAVTDSIFAATDSTYLPEPPIGMYFSNDSTRTDSSLSAAGDSVFISTAESPANFNDTLAIANNLNGDTLINPSVGTATAEDSTTTDKLYSDSVIVDTQTSTSSKPSPVLIGNYPISCNFGLNRTDLNSEELKKLDPVIADLKNDQSRSVLLTGYTDSSGNAAYNLQLSQKRAKSVMDYLTAGGIAADRVEIFGGGVLDSADKYSPNARRVDVAIGN